MQGNSQLYKKKKKALSKKKKNPLLYWGHEKTLISRTLNFKCRCIQRRVYGANLSVGSRDDQDILFKRLRVITV